MNIGNNIRQLRKANHLSQEELAQKCNVSRQTISRWESNEVLPDTNNLLILSKLFNVTLDEVVFGKKQKETNKKKINMEIWYDCSIDSFTYLKYYFLYAKIQGNQ